MVNKQPARRTGFVKVTFTLPRAEAVTVHVMGDFNDWRPVHATNRTQDGGWRLTVELERERAYQYRYLLDGTVWANDPAAEQSVANPYGGENSVVAT